MKNKKTHLVAGLSLSAAIALSGAVASAKAAEHCKVPGSGPTVSKVGKIVPINLLSGAKGYSVEKATGECCGPYAQKCCPQFVGG
ncbi:MAG: hypothetical protein WCJ35_11680 [Planctomycetota bacterium]